MRKSRIADLVKAGKKPVGDGAWGTFLQNMGLAPGECPELWNITHPDEVFRIARSYVDAGSDIIETNSFGGNRIKLSHYGLASRASEINEAAAAISRKAGGESTIVMGSMGPTGKLLMMGDLTTEELYDTFKEQAMALEKGGADALIVETMSDLEETSIALKAARENTLCELICSFTFDLNLDGNYRTMMGNTPVDCLHGLIKEELSLFGTNCGNGIEGMMKIVQEIKSAWPDGLILVQPNAGMPVLQDGKTFFPDSPQKMALQIHELIHAGASVIGGCCGTGPAHIHEFAKLLKN